MDQINRPFTLDEFWRVNNNFSITLVSLTRKDKTTLTEEDKNRLYRDAIAFEQMALRLYENFADQFKHNPRARRVCPNPKCHHIYAYFFEDWTHCPLCGTKLVKTEQEAEE